VRLVDLVAVRIVHVRPRRVVVDPVAAADVDRRDVRASRRRREAVPGHVVRVHFVDEAAAASLVHRGFVAVVVVVIRPAAVGAVALARQPAVGVVPVTLRQAHRRTVVRHAAQAFDVVVRVRVCIHTRGHRRVTEVAHGRHVAGGIIPERDPFGCDRVPPALALLGFARQLVQVVERERVLQVGRAVHRRRQRRAVAVGVVGVCLAVGLVARPGHRARGHVHARAGIIPVTDRQSRLRDRRRNAK
jgi:hypothetical protein